MKQAARVVQKCVTLRDTVEMRARRVRQGEERGREYRQVVVPKRWTDIWSRGGERRLAQWQQ
eukprot:1545872-Pleurochrysis_carterae.AAC.1